jgi:hypothetical protein
VKTDQTAAAFDERFQRRLLAIVHVAGVSLIDHQDVSMRKLGRAGGMQRAVDDRPVLGQDLAPVSEKLGIVVQAQVRGSSGPPGGICACRLGSGPEAWGARLQPGRISRLSGLRGHRHEPQA